MPGFVLKMLLPTGHAHPEPTHLNFYTFDLGVYVIHVSVKS